MTRTEPTAWLCPPLGAPRLEYVASEHTDIRALFQRVRAALAPQQPDARVATLPRRAVTTAARKGLTP